MAKLRHLTCRPRQLSAVDLSGSLHRLLLVAAEHLMKLAARMLPLQLSFLLVLWKTLQQQDPHPWAVPTEPLQLRPACRVAVTPHLLPLLERQERPVPVATSHSRQVHPVLE